MVPADAFPMIFSGASCGGVMSRFEAMRPHTSIPTKLRRVAYCGGGRQYEAASLVLFGSPVPRQTARKIT